MRSKTKGLKVITGPTASGKTEKLIQIARKYNIARVCTIGVGLSDLYQNEFMYHMDVENQNGPPEKLVVGGSSVFLLDDVHLHESVAVDYLRRMANRKLVICACTDEDVHGDAFMVTARLLAHADEVIKLSSICAICYADASKSRMWNDEKVPMCRTCAIKTP